jgi:hypothetical protein
MLVSIEKIMFSFDVMKYINGFIPKTSVYVFLEQTFLYHEITAEVPH